MSYFDMIAGAVAERLKALDLKSSDSARGPWVRIPPAPFSLYSSWAERFGEPDPIDDVGKIKHPIN